MDNGIKVFCPVHKRNIEVFGYVTEIKDGNPVIEPNGCDQCDNSPECKQCMAAAERILAERFLSTDSLSCHPLSEEGR